MGIREQTPSPSLEGLLLICFQFVVFAGVLCQVASLSEMSSVQPIAGAQYHWTWHLAPPKYRRSITWMQGWSEHSMSNGSFP